MHLDLGGRIIGALAAVLVLAAVATAIGLYALWPRQEVTLPPGAQVGNAVPGTTFPHGDVEAVETFACDSFGGPGVDQGTVSPDDEAAGEATCAHVTVTVGSGEGEGDVAQIDVSDPVVAAGLEEGDEIILVRTPTPEAQSGEASYSFFDIARGRPLTLLAGLFALVVVAVARWRGLFALVGLGVAGIIMVEFVLPALLLGESATMVGMVGSSAILLVVLYLAHGPSARTSTALVGTLLGVALTAAIGHVAVSATSLTGVGSEETGQLTALADQVSLRGLLVCGVIVAGLGVLNDVTITQVSAVWELKSADPSLRRRELYTSAMRIGRDHIASTVYTVVFAYAGAGLVTLLLIELLQFRLADVVGTETIAEEGVRTLASGIGLVLTVPVTTAMAVFVVAASRGTPE